MATREENAMTRKELAAWLREWLDKQGVANFPEPTGYLMAIADCLDAEPEIYSVDWKGYSGALEGFIRSRIPDLKMRELFEGYVDSHGPPIAQQLTVKPITCGECVHWRGRSDYGHAECDNWDKIIESPDGFDCPQDGMAMYTDHPTIRIYRVTGKDYYCPHRERKDKP